MITDYIGGEGSAETPKNDYVIYGWPLNVSPSRGGVGLHPSGKYINMSIHIFRIQWLICPFQCGSLCDRLWFMWEPRRRGVPFQPTLFSSNCTLDPVTWNEISQNQNHITSRFQDSYCRLSTLSQLMLEFWNPLGNRGMMKADYSNSTCT